MAQKYEVLIGLNYTDENDKPIRKEPGDLADDIPEKSVKWLLRDGAIRKAKKEKS